MWYIKFSWTILILAALFSLVTGSCLEYGHSCWGAHGKRSGGKAAMATKLQPSTAYAVDTLAEQLFNNNNPEDIEDNNNNNLALAASAALPATSQIEPLLREQERTRNRKWSQLMRQQRFELRQQQQQQQQHGQYDGSNSAAESWRKLQQALLIANQAEQPRTPGELYELDSNK